MFTGIVERVGSVLDIAPLPHDSASRRIEIGTDFAAELTLGESVSVQGTCLTVVSFDPSRFSAEISPTTLRHSTWGERRVGDPVNLERSVTPETRLGGHWVQGHVDDTGVVVDRQQEGTAVHLFVAFPVVYQGLVLPKGSITVDGVSLTVVTVAGGDLPRLQCTIIPHTQSHTTLEGLAIGNRVNLEFDVLGKYVQSLLAAERGEAPNVSTEP